MATFRLTGGTLVLPSASVTDEQVKTPGTGEAAIDADKLQHLHKPGTNFDLAIGATPVAREEIVFTATAPGSIRAAHALLNDTGTTGSITIDVKVNGVSVLSATFSVTSSDTDRQTKDGTINTPALVAGDVVSISMAISAPDGSGPFAWVEIEEDAA